MENSRNDPFFSTTESSNDIPFDALWYSKMDARPDQIYLEGVFRKGLKVESKEEWETLEKHFKEKCQEIKNFSKTSSEYRESQEEVDWIINKPVKQIISDLDGMYEYVPRDWLHGHFVAYIKQQAKESYKETRVVHPATEPSRSSIVPREIDGDWPRPDAGVIALWEMIYILEVIGAEHHQFNRKFEMVASRCVKPSDFGGHPHQHQLEVFLDGFQQLLDNKEAEPFDLRKGTLQCTSDNALPFNVESQRDFELAITNLYHRRCQGWHLKFFFFPDLPTPQKVRAPAEDIPSGVNKRRRKQIELSKLSDSRISGLEVSELRKIEEMEPIHAVKVQPEDNPSRVDKGKRKEEVPGYHPRSSELVFIEGAANRKEAERMEREKFDTEEEARRQTQIRVNASIKKETETKKGQKASESTKKAATPKPNRRTLTPHKISNPEHLRLIREVIYRSSPRRILTELTA